MKIVCDSCGAKYSIADEKVAGKVFKIRCKKCSAVIVVRGDQVPAHDESTAVYDYQQGGDGGGGGAPAAAGAPDAVWHVVVNGDQQGPFAPGDIGGMLSAGTIDWEAYVWREGFGDWMPARDVQELVDAIMGGAPQAAAAQPAADAYGGGGAAAGYADAGGGGGGLFAASGDGAFSGGGGGYGGGADLFAKQEAGSSPFEGSADDDVVASTPSPRVAGDQAMTGQRNENSVLFSLANLQALATGPGGGPAAAAPAAAARPGHASGEGSGLIDIRSLATATGVGGGPAMSPMAGGGGKKESVDDLLSIGTGPALGGLGAPVLAPVQEEKSNRGLIIAIGVAAGVFAIAAVAVIAVVVSQEPEPLAAQTAGAPTATGTGAIAPGAGTEPAATGTTPAGTQGTTATPTGTEGTMAAEEEEEEEEEGEEEGSSGSSSRGSRSGSRPRGTGSSGSMTTTTATMETATEAPRMTGGSGSIDDLLNAALGDMSTMTASAAMTGTTGGGGDLPDTPSRDEVGRALRSVQGAVSACGQGQHGVAMTAITVSGSTGRVTNAQVSGQFAGTPVGSCVARAVRGAQFSRFRRPTFNVSFPYRI